MTRSRYSLAARTHASTLKKRFDASLHAVAESLAAHDGMETVQVSHVDRAHKALLSGEAITRPFYARREFQVGSGTFLASSAVTFGTISYNLISRDGAIPDGTMFSFWLWVVAVPLVILTVGMGLAIAGWLRA